MIYSHFDINIFIIKMIVVIFIELKEIVKLMKSIRINKFLKSYEIFIDKRLKFILKYQKLLSLIH